MVENAFGFLALTIVFADLAGSRKDKAVKDCWPEIRLVGRSSGYGRQKSDKGGPTFRSGDARPVKPSIQLRLGGMQPATPVDGMYCRVS